VDIWITWILVVNRFVNEVVLTVEVIEQEYGGNVYTKLVRMERWSWHYCRVAVFKLAAPEDCLLRLLGGGPLGQTVEYGKRDRLASCAFVRIKITLSCPASPGIHS
jgi:hypothetical protein